MSESKIERLDINEYSKCNNIWDMKKCPFTDNFYAQIKSGNRIVYIYKLDGEFIGEGALVVNHSDEDYYIADRRIYLSRMIVKKEYRRKGIGTQILKFLIEKAKELGYSEISIGVDKDNIAALNLYRKMGFNTIIKEDEDEYGKFYKLLKELKL